MINSVSKLVPANGLEAVQSLGAADKKNVSGVSFADALTGAIEKINTQAIQADQMTAALASGQAPDLHTVMITSEKASVSFQMAVQIRNKALEAYQEIMRMQM